MLGDDFALVGQRVASRQTLLPSLRTCAGPTLSAADLQAAPAFGDTVARKGKKDLLGKPVDLAKMSAIWSIVLVNLPELQLELRSLLARI